MPRSPLLLLFLLGLPSGCSKSAPATDSPKVSPAATSASPASASTPPKEGPKPAARWDPAKTRAFVVCLAQFEGEAPGNTSFSTEDRNDIAMVELLKARGVPKDNIVFLKDGDATAPNIKQAFSDHLKKSAPDELLFFYYGSHGGYDADKGTHTFSTFESSLPITWAFESIEQDFKGSRAMMFADSCYSGGLVLLAQKQSGRVAYAALASTGAHNVAYSGWRFVDVLARAFSGNPVVDVSGAGHVEFDSLARYAEHHMAFVAEGKPIYATTKGFDAKLILADDKTPRKSAEVGKYVQVEWHGNWYQAEVIDVDGPKRKVHYTSYGSSSDEWITPDRMRPYAYKKYAKGAKVECQAHSSKKWYAGEVLDAFDNMHLCHYDGWTSAWDEWMSPSRIREAVRDASAP